MGNTNTSVLRGNNEYYFKENKLYLRNTHPGEFVAIYHSLEHSPNRIIMSCRTEASLEVSIQKLSPPERETLFRCGRIED